MKRAGAEHRLSASQEKCIEKLARELVNETDRSIAVPPLGNEEGYWFGGGNVVEGGDGRLYLSGRYRNPGDSRHGLGKGIRGLELSIFVSEDRGATFHKLLSFSKEELSGRGAEVISIEGSSLLVREEGVELYVSSEKDDGRYPPSIASFRKPGTGVWSIDRLTAPSFEKLADSEVVSVVTSDHPSHLHVKDPVAYPMPNGDTYLFFCTHPYTWASSNTALWIRQAASERFEPAGYDVLPRGDSWDVAISRLTGLLDLPRAGMFSEGPEVTLVFYDGGECLRNHTPHETAVERARGYSCEEIGGLAYVLNHDFSNFHRISEIGPIFVSPWGTGASRYTSLFASKETVSAFWEQSQPDRSQPLVSHTIEYRRLIELLSEGGA